MKTNGKFLNFPITLLRAEKFSPLLNSIFDVGIYLCSISQSFKGSEERKYKQALDYLGIDQKNTNNHISNAMYLLEQIPENSPYTGIEKEMLFDNYKNHKSEFDQMCLRAFLAIKSILGKKEYVKTNKALIFARMFGYSAIKDIPAELTPLQEKYKTRWWMDKVLLELQLNWYLKSLWNHNRGFYLSFDKSIKELAIIIEDDKYITKKRKLQEEKRKAIKSINR